MACSIAENEPLKRLELELGLDHQCHSSRPKCLLGKTTKLGEGIFGIPGAAIGYCQALFHYAGNPRDHTSKVRRLLADIDAPWGESHELFWGHRTAAEEPETFVNEAIEPLLGTGRIPVVISALDPAKNYSEIASIFASRPLLHSGETVLLRLQIGGEESIRSITQLIKSTVSESRRTTTMPSWWPLLQGELTSRQWKDLKNALGEDWKYANLAINPFVSPETFALIQNQITVAQIPIGAPKGISDDGDIRLAPGMRISGAQDGASYSLRSYMDLLGQLEVAPTLIVLGPSLPEWSDETNQERIKKLLPILRSSCDLLWNALPKTRREFVWKLAA